MPFLFRVGEGNNDNWIRAEVSLDSPRPFYIEFVATVGTGEKGDIVLDDVSFSHGCMAGGRSVALKFYQCMLDRYFAVGASG